MAGQPPTGVLTRTFKNAEGVLTTATLSPGDFNSVTELAGSFGAEPTEAPDDDDAATTKASTSDSSSSGSGSSGTSPTPSTLATSATPRAGTAAEQTSDVTGVASGSNGETLSEQHQDSCNSISCNPALQAAIAVPVVVVSLLLLALLFFFIRRRRRRLASPVSEKKKKPKKKWSRHLRVFSFDAELLMGGRFSSSNSLRSGETGSQRSSNRGVHNASPSIHSIEEEVAPPYRDAITHTQPPSTVPMAGGMTSRTPDPFPRPDSTATAPPPYPAGSPPPEAGSSLAAGAALGGLATAGLSRNTSRASTQNIQTPVSTRSINDPFRNDTLSPVSPVENGPDSSPFVDPPEEAPSPTSPTATHPMISRAREIEIMDDARSDVSSNVEVGSVREAQIGRKLSTKAGRVVNGRGSS